MSMYLYLFVFMLFLGRYFRGLEFIVVFCDALLQGTDDLTTASNQAYTKTLKQFHNFVNRGAYAVSLIISNSVSRFISFSVYSLSYSIC